MPASLIAVGIAVYLFVPGYLATSVQRFVVRSRAPVTDFARTIEALAYGFAAMSLVVLVASVGDRGKSCILGCVESIALVGDVGEVVAPPGGQATEVPQTEEVLAPRRGLAWRHLGWHLKCLGWLAFWCSLCGPLLGTIVGAAARSRFAQTAGLVHCGAWPQLHVVWDAMLARKKQPRVMFIGPDDVTYQGVVKQVNIHPDPPALWLYEVQYWDDESRSWSSPEFDHLYLDGSDLKMMFVTDPELDQAPGPEALNTAGQPLDGPE